MYEGVDSIDPCHHKLILHEILLDRKLPKDVKPLLGSDNLERMLFRAMNRAFDYPYCSGSSSKLVHLF